MKTFYQILGNTVLSSITNMTVWFAITFFVYLETKDVLATSMIAGIYLITVALTGFWFGSLVDHNKKKNVMMFSSVTSLILFIIAFLIYVLSPKEYFRDLGNAVLWIFAIISLFGVIVGNVRTICLPTLVTILVNEDKRDKANGLSGTVTGVSFLITSVISGILVGMSGMFLVLIIAIVTTIITIIHLAFINIPEKQIVHLTDSPDTTKKVDIKGTIKVIKLVPGLMALILFATFNNFLGGVFMSLMDAYGLTLVSVEIWGILMGVLSSSFIIGGVIISKFGLGKNPMKSLFLANIAMWIIAALFTIQPSIILLSIGIFMYMCLIPFVEASEQTILQKVVPLERQGRVFGFAQSIEQAASPLTAFTIGPIAKFIFIPFMTTGPGVQLIGGWFGVGPGRGIALVFVFVGIIGLLVTILAMRSKYYNMLSNKYLNNLN